MSPPPRQLTFAVSTGLLTASLATGVACNKHSHPVNVHPDAEPKHVNEGPESPEETVNEGPVEEPADDPEETVNEESEPEEPEPGPNVNVVAPD